MRLYIREAKVVDPRSAHHGQVVDILIENGKIARVGKGLQLQEDPADKTQVIHIENLHVSPGWVDTFVQFHDPGQEHKETLKTGTDAAAAGGFTEVLAVPNTNPVVQGKGQVEYLTNGSKNLKARVHPIGAVSRNLEGKELAEMYDMHTSGAKAFGDGWKPLQSAGLLLKALQYVKTVDGTVIQVPDDTTIGAHGLMHEGIVSTRMGLPGKPLLAEEIMVERDLKLLEYTNSSLHFTGITSPKSIEAIKAAQQRGLNVTCSVTPHHLYFCDEDLEGYDTNLKVTPALVDRKQMEALRQAVKQGNVDMITSHHLPQDYDAKVCEFEYAKPGAIGLESAFGAVWSLLEGQIKLEHWVDMVSIKPREVFHLDKAELKEQHEANLTLFVPGETYTFEKTYSASKNSPFLGKTLKGRVIGTVLNHQINVSQ
ncbi:dihydroorotase [Dinghuibacter silviterrae]|uniref:Dihydroorotase n=1 Tax=Dinghuibacter silviterrae TaxID=1539049 RepID=A0A4R8DV65_9BACT|nr:dihydroorotase [Dinghuibacter silviterrae]TDX02310.1 dihydroorotase [Dinghuibacter silviterrae]